MDLTRISRGTGDTELELYLEPTCPFSSAAFAKIDPLLNLVGEDKLTVTIRLLSQPWHLFSGIVTRCVLASFANGGLSGGLHSMAVVYDHRDDFDMIDHCSGPNMNRSPSDIVAQISDLSGHDLSEAFRLEDVGRALRWHTRYARQNGAHVTPTFAVDRLVNEDMSSSQSVEEWRDVIGL